MLEEFEWYLYSDVEDSVLTIYTEPLKPSRKSKTQKSNNKEAKIPKGREEKIINKISKVLKKAKDNKTEEDFINENGFSCIYSSCLVKCFAMNTFIKHIIKPHQIPCVWKDCSFKGKCSCELQKHLENHWNKFKGIEQKETDNSNDKTKTIETVLSSSIKFKKDIKAKPEHNSVRPLSDSIIFRANSVSNIATPIQDKPKLINPPKPEPKTISKPQPKTTSKPDLKIINKPELKIVSKTPPVAAKTATKLPEHSKPLKKIKIENDSTESKTDSDSKEILPIKRGVTAKKTVVPPGKRMKRFTACGESPYVEDLIKKEIQIDYEEDEDEKDQTPFIKNLMERKKAAQKWNPSDAFARALEAQRF
ncbi:unnamed protein product [Blepharisma stoltei]|uniref:C2H2-type domain-containing protein n=1 Tax=Blepharisma stoltei TaxID=1481888 RepID=A0AAU9JNJ0_9CILI|nr:unnamed protein product [Blepharisma stoltei]